MKRYLNSLLIVSLTSFCCLTLVMAGDEDMNPSVYQKFDPETGFMVPVNVNPTGQHSKHGSTPAQTPPAVTDGSSKPVSTPAQTPSVASDINNTPVTVQAGSNDHSILWAGGLLGLILIGGYVLLGRKRQQQD